MRLFYSQNSKKVKVAGREKVGDGGKRGRQGSDQVRFSFKARHSPLFLKIVMGSHCKIFN